MSGKIKLLLVILALGALFSVSYFYAMLKGGLTADISAAITPAADPCAGTKGLSNCDDDHDGLVNRDEAYWGTDQNNPDTDGDGFLDGEEVMTGHDPRKAGPDDYLDPGQNLTQRTIQLTLGGIMSGNLNPSSSSYVGNIDKLAAAAADQYAKNTMVVVDKFQIVPDSQINKISYGKAISDAISNILSPATEDIEAFLRSIGDVKIGDVSSLTSDDKRYNQFIQYAHSLAASMGERANRLASIPVPLSFSIQHTSLIKFLRIEQKYLELLTRLKSDPMQGEMILSDMLRMQSQVLPQMMYDLTRAFQTNL